MSAQLGRADRPRFAARDPVRTDAEVRDAFDGYTAYFGTYSVDESKSALTHRVVGASDPNWVGVDLTRYYAFDERGTPSALDAADRSGRPVARGRLLWERIS